MCRAFNIEDSFAKWFLSMIGVAADLLLATTAFVIAKVAAFLDPMQPLPKRFYKYYVLAVSKLRERLQIPGAWADDAAIVTVLFLALTELANGHLGAYEVHKKQVCLMVSARGGIGRFGDQSLVRSALLQ